MPKIEERESAASLSAVRPESRIRVITQKAMNPITVGAGVDEQVQLVPQRTKRTTGTHLAVVMIEDTEVNHVEMDDANFCRLSLQHPVPDLTGVGSPTLLRLRCTRDIDRRRKPLLLPRLRLPGLRLPRIRVPIPGICV